MEDERLSIGRGGGKQGAEGHRLCQHHARAAGVAAEAAIIQSINSVNCFFIGTFISPFVWGKKYKNTNNPTCRILWEIKLHLVVVYDLTACDSLYCRKKGQN